MKKKMKKKIEDVVIIRHITNKNCTFYEIQSLVGEFIDLIKRLNENSPHQSQHVFECGPEYYELDQTFTVNLKRNINEDGSLNWKGYPYEWNAVFTNGDKSLNVFGEVGMEMVTS